ncbi:zinc finger CCCH domain-containing protein [Salix suchowensis]|nr:zinc finger CCCH domain-containing protein [Salix suchowensis]
METEEEKNSINPPRSSTELENESNLTTTITTTTTDTESVPELNESNPSQLGVTDTALLQQQSQPPQSETQTTVVDKSDAQDFAVGDSKSVSPQHLVIEVREVVEATEGSGEIEAPQEVVEKEVENRDLVAEERSEDASGNENAGNNEMETETEGVADVAAELETETLNQEVETMEEQVAEVKEESEEAENTDSMEKADVVEEKNEGADVVDKVEMDRVVKEAETVRVKEEEERKNEMTDIAEEIEVAGQLETTDVSGGTEQAINEEEEDMETKMMDVAEEGDNEEDTEMEMAEKGNEGEDMADEAEGVGEGVEEVGRSGGGKRKRVKNAKTPSRATSKKKMEEDVCFICFDGGELVLCDRRGCSKAYHPSCVNRDEAFFRAKGRWNCGWHLCSNCVKNAYYMCYTCTFSLCKGCIKDAVILCVRGNKGFCETCMKTIMLMKVMSKEARKRYVQVDFDDKSSWEYLFKDYWTDLKERLSLTPEELAQAKNPWKGSDAHTGKQELADELYDVHNDGGSGSDSSAEAEVTTSRRRKPKKRLRSRAKEKDSPGSVSWAEGESADERVEWASKELLEFVMHMKNGDKSACSQFDVQALLLDYIKRNKLRDPRRKSQIICDSRLENLFGKPRVGHFEMLKLLESHFLLKDDLQADDLQGSVVDTETSQLEADGNSDTLTKASKDKRRKSRKKGEGRGLQSNIDDYAAIDMHNINLIYLRRSLLEDLIEDTEAFHDKVVGSFVRIRISGNAQKQDLYRLVQVIGTSKAAEAYRVGKKMTSFMLEILNLNKTELVSIDIISNQEFTEDECKRLRQSIKCGLINRLTVGDIQEKAMAIQAVRVQDSLESEITRLSHLRDRASDMGHRKEYPLLAKFYQQFYLFYTVQECVEKLQLLKTPEERQRRLEEIPEIHADPNMDPSHESDEDEGETEDKRQENSLRPRGSGFSKKGREPISPRKGGFTSNDIWGGSKSYSSTNRELSRNLSDKGFSYKGDDIGGGESVNENFWGQGREKQTQQSQSTNSTAISESLPEIAPATPSTVVTQSAAKVNEAEKIWHYQDPSGKIQGPFSMVQLRKWSNTGYFPADLRIWRDTGMKDDSILLNDALSGNFHRDPPAVEDNSFLKTQLVQSPHLPSSFTGNIAQAAPVPVEVPKFSPDRWNSGTNLPSPTPGQTTPSLTKGQVFESQWSPTPAQPVGSALGANQSSGGNVELQGANVIPGTPSKMSHGVGPLPKLEPGKLSISSNGPQMHSQSTLPGESPKIQVNSHMHSVLDPSGTSVNAIVDMRSLQNLVQPGTSGNSLVGTHRWGASSIPRPEMNASQAVTGTGSQAWGSTQSQKPEANNLVSMPSQPGAYNNWGNAQTSVRNPSSSLTTGTPSGVSPMPSTGTNPWRAPVPGPSNIQPSVPSSGPWGMGITDNQGATPRQGPENQNTGWGPVPGNQNMGWGVSLPANSNQGWAVPGQVPSAGNVNPGWGAPVQGQAPGNPNPGWGAPAQGQAPGNAFSGWGPSGQGLAPTNASTGWASPSQGPPPPASANTNTNWSAPTGNAGAWGSSHGGDPGYGGGKPWNRQSSFNRSRDPPRPPFKGQRVCKYHEHGHCKKGASCDYMHN